MQGALCYARVCVGRGEGGGKFVPSRGGTGLPKISTPRRRKLHIRHANFEQNFRALATRFREHSKTAVRLFGIKTSSKNGLDLGDIYIIFIKIE